MLQSVGKIPLGITLFHFLKELTHCFRSKKYKKLTIVFKKLFGLGSYNDVWELINFFSKKLTYDLLDHKRTKSDTFCHMNCRYMGGGLESQNVSSQISPYLEVTQNVLNHFAFGIFEIQQILAAILKQFAGKLLIWGEIFQKLLRMTRKIFWFGNWIFLSLSTNKKLTA